MGSRPSSTALASACRRSSRRLSRRASPIVTAPPAMTAPTTVHTMGAPVPYTPTSEPTAAPAAVATSTRLRSPAALLIESVGIELVPDPPDGEDELGDGIVPFDLLAQPSHVDVDRSRFHVYLLAPDQVEQLQAIVRLVGILHEE